MRPRAPARCFPVRVLLSRRRSSSRETFIEREPGESANDRNDRAIRVATRWYREHLKGGQLRVVLLTDDLGNKQRAERDGLLVYRCTRLFPSSALSWFVGAV